MTTRLVPKPLRGSHCYDLGSRLRQADLDDLTLHEEQPIRALLQGMRAGEAYSVWDGHEIIGAGGWTEEGRVWTLWADLTVAQSRELLRMSRPWARILAIRAKRPLSNVFLAGNAVTERWLRMTDCVDILDAELLPWQGRMYVPFYLKPLERLPNV